MQTIVRGPDAEEYGASNAYPIGDRSTYFRVPSWSALTAISTRSLRGGWSAGLRRRHRWRAPPRNRRSATRLQARRAPSTTTSHGTLPPVFSSPATTRSSSSAISTRGATGTASPCGQWPRRSPRCSSESLSRRAAFAQWTIGPPPTSLRWPAPSMGALRSGTCSMSSGVRFVEEYSGRDDVSMLGRRHVHADRRGGRRRGQTFQHAGRASRHQVLLCLRRDAVLGLVLRRAVGLPVADYLHDKLWAPMGAEADATWLIDRSDQEATLSQRGAARLRAARPSPRARWAAARPTGDPRWLAGGRDERTPGSVASPTRNRHAVLRIRLSDLDLPGAAAPVLFLGVRGQAIYVDPSSRLVMVHTAVRKQPVDLAGARELGALWGSLVRDFGR